MGKFSHVKYVHVWLELFRRDSGWSRWVLCNGVHLEGVPNGFCCGRCDFVSFAPRCPCSISAHTPNNDGVWIGLNDQSSEGEWIWAADQSQPQYTNWFKGQPSGGTKENCAFIDGGDGKWYDFFCNDQWPFWCETSPTSSSP